MSDLNSWIGSGGPQPGVALQQHIIGNVPQIDDGLQKYNSKTKRIADNTEEPQLGFVSRKLQEYAKTIPLEGQRSNARIFLESVAHGKRGDITEKDFTPEELQSLKTIVYSKHANNVASPTGRIGYRDYAGVGGGANIQANDTPAGSVKTVIGSAGYEVNPLTTEAVVTDKYDFDPLPRPLGVMSDPTKQGIARYLGEQLFPPGKGRNVRISLGKLKE